MERLGDGQIAAASALMRGLGLLLRVRAARQAR